MVTGTCRNRGVLLQHFADAFKRTNWRSSNCVRHRIIGPGPAAFGPHEIIFAIFEEHHWTLDIVFGSDFLESRAVWKIEESCEIRLEPRDIAVRPTAVNEVVLFIHVAEYELIDRLSSIPNDADQGLAE